MKPVDPTSVIVAAVVYSGCADAVAGILTEAAREAEWRGEDERARVAGALADAVLQVQRIVSERCSADLAAARRN